jgi:hypothetical protein
VTVYIPTRCLKTDARLNHSEATQQSYSGLQLDPISRQLNPLISSILLGSRFHNLCSIVFFTCLSSSFIRYLLGDCETADGLASRVILVSESQETHDHILNLSPLWEHPDLEPEVRLYKISVCTLQETGVCVTVVGRDTMLQAGR